MSKFLNQTDIDRLLDLARARDDAAAAGESREEAVAPYDFVSPTRAANELTTLLRAVHETYQYALVSGLSGQLRAPVEVDLLGVDPLSFQEYSLSLHNPSVLGLFEMGTGEGVMEIQPPLAAAMIERLFGGSGDPTDAVRELTPIENAVMSRLLTHLIRELESAWREHTPETSLTLRSVERNPQFVQSIVPSEVVLLTSYEIRVGGCTGLITLAYPQSTLDPVARDAVTLNRAARAVGWDGDPNHPVARRIRDVSVEIVAELGTADVSVGDIANLEVGDVLRLDRRVGDDIDVLVGEVAKLRARPGVRRASRALMITRVEKDTNDE